MTFEDIITIVSNPSISAILGAIAGASATFIPTMLIEKKKHDRLKNNIKKFVRIELEEIQNIVNRCLEEGEKRDNRVYLNSNSGIRKKLLDVQEQKKITGHNYFIFRVSNYPQLSGETKAIVFENDLDSLEYTYRKINELKLIRPPELSTEDYFEEDKCMNLLESLTDAIKRLK